MTQIELPELERLNPPKKKAEKAVKVFKTTNDFREAGYILEDGRLLDLSGKHEGGTPGTRSYDHRELCRAINTGGKGISGDKCMDFFERNNNIRYGMAGHESGRPNINISLNTYQKPTEKQITKMKQSIGVCRHFGPCNLFYDIYNKDGSRCESGDAENASQNDIEKVLNALKRCKRK